jgi:hypothetical protein
MTIRTPFRTLAAASLVALALMAAPAGLAHAAPNVVKLGCEGAGYMWDDVMGCANKPCPGGGTPGEVRVVTTTGGQTVGYYRCDGFTGQWETWGMSRTPQSGITQSR